LPGITVTAPAYTARHGGYLISGDFKTDPRIPYAVFPARALDKDDILSVHPVHLNDDEYLVLQKCAVSGCRMARLVRVWGTTGALTPVHNSDDRIWIKHGNKFFIWLMQLPEIAFPDCAGCPTHFVQFQLFSPPLTLIPAGRVVAYHRAQLHSKRDAHPIAVKSSQHDGATFIVTFASGSVVRIKRMRPAH
jgi:hypothetical protein